MFKYFGLVNTYAIQLGEIYEPSDSLIISNFTTFSGSFAATSATT
jgi:hypothetical protein